ncbi:MAG: ATP-binding cassette domain-containing protein [Thermodesulfobacteriota bacterium]|nr:ATP-binding cassette domain-containing protein [Thermodesulfobacteriota bacterium]
MKGAYLEVAALNLSLGGFRLSDIHLVCKKGAYRVLLGPTGSGKSSLMKCILGFHIPASGAVYLNGTDISRRAPENRRMGYVPQNYSLFPHLSVENNIRFGLPHGGKGDRDADRRVERLCGMLNIAHLRRRGIRNLSGGERQKVALARALATEPELILLDEPFSAIDEGSKRNLWIDMKKVINEIGITAIHITHNLEEAYSMGEQMSVLLNGVIHQSGTPEEIFERPATKGVARYLNYRNIFSGVARSGKGGTIIDTGDFSVFVQQPIPEGRRMEVCIRQQDIKVLKTGQPVRDALKHNVFSGRIVSVFALPEYCLIYFRINGSGRPYDFEIKLPPYLRERHHLYPDKEAAVAFWGPNIIRFLHEDGTGGGVDEATDQ